MSEPSKYTKSGKPVFPLQESITLVKDLLKPNPWIYWLDFILSISIAWGGFYLALTSIDFSFLQIIGYLASSFAMYRAVIFVHELAHLKKGTFKGLKWAWNLLCGAPFLVPSFSYIGVHLDHHKRNTYGTEEDGEYLPLGTGRPFELVAFVLLSLVLPVVLVVRTLVLTPLSYLFPSVQNWVWKHLSSLAIDFRYVRPLPKKEEVFEIRFQELIPLFYSVVVLSLVYVQLLPSKVLLLWYLVAALIFFVNSLRTLAAHAYRNNGEKMDITAQFLDSVDIPGNLFTGLWAPVGLRYHATHHLFPYMPYHNLARARHRLITKLEDPSLYLEATRSGMWSAIYQLWTDANRSDQTDSNLIVAAK